MGLRVQRHLTWVLILLMVCPSCILSNAEHKLKAISVTWDMISSLTFSKPFGYMEKGCDFDGTIEIADKSID